MNQDIHAKFNRYILIHQAKESYRNQIQPMNKELKELDETLSIVVSKMASKTHVVQNDQASYAFHMKTKHKLPPLNWEFIQKGYTAFVTQTQKRQVSEEEMHRFITFLREARQQSKTPEEKLSISLVLK